MESLNSRDADSEDGGWSSTDEDSDSSEYFDIAIHSDGAMEKDTIVDLEQNSEPLEGLPEFGPYMWLETLPFGTTALVDLLRHRLLDQSSFLPRNWKLPPRAPPSEEGADASPGLFLPFPRLFDHVAKTIVEGASKGVLGRWIDSATAECTFHLLLPTSLNHPFFVTSAVNLFAASWPFLHVVAAILTNTDVKTNGLKQSPVEHLLMFLCLQLLPNPDPDWNFSELLEEIKDAFSGLNCHWRESLLWDLLSYLLTNGKSKHRLLALSFPDDDASILPEFIPTITKLQRLAESTERKIQILLLLGSEHGSDWSSSRSVTVDMSASTIQESLRADISSCFLKATANHPSMRVFEDQLVGALLDHLPQPLSIVSTIHALLNSPWISVHQLTAVSFLRSSNELVFKRILESERPFVVNIMGILSYCGRPLTTIELVEAVAAAQLEPHSSLAQFSEVVPVDLEYSIHHTLSGLVYVENGLVWSLLARKDQISRENFPSWLDLGAMAEMKLAFLCLSYINMWSNLHEDLPASSRNSLDSKWPFLNYAVTFWHRHFSRAAEKGASAKDVVRLLDDKPGLLGSWLQLLGAFDIFRLSMPDEIKATNTAHLSSTTIAEKYSLRPETAIAVVNLASQIIPAMDNDSTSAITVSLWHFEDRKPEVVVPAWLEKLGCNFSFKSLARAFHCLPESASSLILLAQDDIKQFATSLIIPALRQGNAEVVRECLNHMALDAELHSLLFRISSSVEGECISIPQDPHTEALPTGEQNSGLKKELLRRAVKYHRLELVDVLLRYDPNLSYLNPLEHEHILVIATEAGQIGTIKKLTQAYKTTFLGGTWGVNTSLHCASAHNFLDIAKFLLENGASVSTRDGAGDTPLHVTARFGYLDMVKLFVEANKRTLADSRSSSSQKNRDSADFSKGAKRTFDVDEPLYLDNALEMENYSGRLPIEVALQSDHLAIVSVLLINTPRSSLLSGELLHIAARRGNVKFIQSLQEYGGLDPDKRDSVGMTPLEVACSLGHVDIAKALLKLDATSWPAGGGNCPFTQLFSVDNESAAKELALLLTSERQKPIKSILNQALCEAAIEGKTMLMTVLLDAGADKNSQWRKKRTPLHICAYEGNVDAVRLLIMRGADLTLQDSYGDTPLADASINGHYDVIRVFLQRGERYPTDGENCPLIGMTERGDKTALELVLQLQEEFRGAPMLAKCFHVALRMEKGEILLLLLKYNADPNSGSSEYGNALIECAYYGNIKMARVLLDYPGNVKGNEVNTEAGPYHTALIAAVSWKYMHQSRRSFDSSYKKKIARREAKQKKMIEFLMKRGGDHMKKGGKFGTMFNAAGARGSPGLIDYLIDKVGFKVNETDHEGRNIGHISCSRLNVLDSVENLKALGKRSDFSTLLWRPDKLGRLPIHFACGGQRLEIVKYLFSEDTGKEKVNEPDEDGWTPLHWACRQWDPLVVSFLVNKMGARTDSVDKKMGWTPWEVAVFHGNIDFADILRMTSSASESDADFGLSSRVRVANSHSATCDSCQCWIKGVRYRCQDCDDFDICFKCHDLGIDFHRPKEGHRFWRTEKDEELALLISEKKRNEAGQQAEATDAETGVEADISN